MFFLLRHLTFILHHPMLIVKNTFSHILTCMLEKQNNDFNLIVKPTNLSLLQKNRSSNLKWKEIPSQGYFVNTID